MKNDEKTAIQPRLLRPPQAHAYLGISRGKFNEKVRPYVKEIRLGSRGIAFDRHELDRWVETQASVGDTNDGVKLWQRKTCQALLRGGKYGTLTSRSQDMDAFAAAQALATTKRQSVS